MNEEEVETTEEVETVEETEEAEAVAEVEEEEVTEQLPKKSKVQKRIDKLVGEKYAYERRIAELEAESRVRAEYSTPQKQLQVTDSKPVIDNFETTEEYYEALTDWKVEQKLSSYSEKQKATQKKQEAAKTQAQKQQDFVSNAQKAMTKYNDYLDVVEDVTIALDSDLGEEILESDELGPELMYYFGKNPEEEAKFSRLSGRKLSQEIGKLQVKLSAPKKKKTTKAPPPITPTGGTSQPAGKVNLKQASADDIYKSLCR